MKTRKLSVATFVLGALGASIAACSAQSSGTPPREDGGGNSSSGGSGTVIGSSGSGVVAAGGTGVVTTGGSTGVAGTSSTGVAGSTTIPAGGATGAGGAAPTPGSCVVAAGVATDLDIDDLEDGDNTIEALGSRIGYWYTYNDGTATQIPAPDPTGAIPFKPATGGHPCSNAKCIMMGSTLFSANTSGPMFTTWGAGLGFDFNNTAKKSCVYNATAYSGIKFWAMGNVAIAAMVKIPATTQSTSDSGTCTTTAMCEDHYAINEVLASAWTQYTITFADATTFKQAGWGVPVAFDKTNIIAMQFQVAKGAAFNFSIDDITFF